VSRKPREPRTRRGAPEGAGSGLAARFGSLLADLEDDARPFVYYAGTFLAAVTLRNLFEFLVSASSLRVLWHHPIHFGLFYLSVALSIILVLTAFSGERVSRVARVVLTAFCITPLVPVVDVLLQPLWSYKIQYQYLVPERISSLGAVFFSFLGGYDGVTPGMRLEILLAAVAGGLYVAHKTSSAVRAVLGGVAIYAVIFWVYGAILYWMTALERAAGLPADTMPRTMIDLYLLLILACLPAVLCLHRPSHCRELAKDSRLSRVLHYEAMVVLGLVLGYPWKDGLFTRLGGFLELFFLFVAVAFACLFSAITNNMADVRTDEVSNPRRPSVSGAIPPGAYGAIAWLALALSLVYALASGSMGLFLVCAFLGNYLIYSLPPLRLKRVPLFSKSLIAVNSLVLILSGYSFAGREINTLSTRLVWFILVAFTACANVIDLKDLEGDRTAGIRTMPVMVGLRGSRLLIGLFFVAAYAVFPWLLGMEALGVYAAGMGLLLFGAINWRSYREGPVLALYLASLLLVLAYLVVALPAGGWLHGAGAPAP